MSILSWLKRRRLDEDDFKDEIRAHLSIAADERIAEGADRREARDASLKDFGNVLLATEAARRVWTPRWVDALFDLANDVRHALRTLAKNPVFAVTVIAVLTLGIGLNATVFTMLKSTVLTPIAGVDGSARLAVVFGETRTGRQLRVSYPDFQYLRDHTRSFSALFGSSLFTANLGRGRGARQVWVEMVTGNYFQALGVRAQLGRTLLPSDEAASGRQPVVVLSDGIWRRDFAADPAIVGKSVDVGNFPLTVVGVADPTFHGTIVSYDVELFVPVTMAAQIGATGGLPPTEAANLLSDHRAAIVFPHGWLKPGSTVATAEAEVDAAWQRLASDRPLSDAAQRLRVVPFWRSPTGGQTFLLPTLSVLSAMGLLVLMIACANIAGLVLVRGVSRRGEIGVRLALGATRARVVRLLVVENLVLAAPGAVFGVVLAQQAIRPLVGYAEQLAAPQRLFFNIQVDALVIAFTALVACGSALVFGAVPALRSSRVDLVTVINEDASPRGAARGRIRGTLVVAQVAVSLLLLFGAGLASRTVDAARLANPGFDSRHVSAVAVDVRQNGYDERAGRIFYRKLLDAARSGPGVESATLAAYVPLGLLDKPAQSVAFEGYQVRKGDDLAFMTNAVGPDYFRTVRIPLAAGRGFDAHDDENAAPVAVVNRTLAGRFLGGATAAIGKRIRVAGGDWRTVVGVAADVKYSKIDEAPRPYVYVPFLQAYRPTMTLHTRGAAPVERLVEQARGFVTTLDADLPVLSAESMASATRGALIFYDLTAMMLFAFGGAGMVLAALGTYGLVSYVVKQSTHEIGIRMALGASRAAVVRGFLRRGLVLGAAGAAVGVVLALGLGRLLGGVLFGVSATDPVSFARALLVVLGGVAGATIVPAWRASRTDPLAALRHQ